jgi:hypothetical protein
MNDVSRSLQAHLDGVTPEVRRHTTGVGCLYIKDLDKIDLSILEAIVAESYHTLTADTYTLRAREGVPDA